MRNPTTAVSPITFLDPTTINAFVERIPNDIDDSWNQISVEKHSVRMDDREQSSRNIWIALVEYLNVWIIISRLIFLKIIAIMKLKIVEKLDLSRPYAACTVLEVTRNPFNLLGDVCTRSQRRKTVYCTMERGKRTLKKISIEMKLFSYPTINHLIRCRLLQRVRLYRKLKD